MHRSRRTGGHLALADPFHAECLDEVVDRAGRDALDVGFLDHRGQCLLRDPARLQEGREVTAVSQLRDPQFDRPGTGLPVAIAIAFALVTSLRRAFTRSRTAQLLSLQRHQPLGRKANHLAQECRIRALLQKRVKGDLVIGHRGGLQVSVACRNPTLPSTAAVTTAVDK